MTPESWRTWITRHGFNLFPAYRGTGGRLRHIARDWSEARVEIPLSWRTRNYVGTIYGGSIYGAVDPVYMIMLIKRLGDDYVVWDKAARIEFRRPGRDTLHADFRVSDEEVATIRERLREERSIDRTYEIEVVDAEGRLHALVEKVLYVRRDDDGGDGPAPP